jgi:DNA-binding transcriptional LysR family regulator
MVNIHHLELFYFVARHGGIAQAVRNMPYGIQQPAISAQIIALEDHLGVTLFRRRPFELTDAGRELFAFIDPFFGRLDEVEARLRGGVSERLRIGASQTVLRDHLPGLLRDLRARYPKLKLTLRAGYQLELEGLIQAGEIDLAVTVIDRTVAAGLKSEILLGLPLALLVPRAAKARTVAEILAADRIEEPLISLRADEALPRMFQQELARRNITWPVAIETGTLELAGTYAAEGFGIALGVDVPGMKPHAGLRVLRLEDFPRLPIGILWSGRMNEVTETMRQLLTAAASALNAMQSTPTPGEGG